MLDFPSLSLSKSFNDISRYRDSRKLCLVVSENLKGFIKLLLVELNCKLCINLVSLFTAIHFAFVTVCVTCKIFSVLD